MAQRTAPAPTKVIVIPALTREFVTVAIVGTTGFFSNRMAAKAKRTLMLGGKKKTAAEKVDIKHRPREEYRDSMSIDREFHEHSNVYYPATAIKQAMTTAALSVPGIYKTSVQRLIYIPEQRIPIFGVPRLHMGIMRSADQKHTPDVRTRAFFPEWATTVTIGFIRPELTETSVLTLLSNAGMIAGIGDSRQEKGKGSFGAFAPASEIPAHLLDAAAQWEAIENPLPADTETAELLGEFDDEVEKRR